MSVVFLLDISTRSRLLAVYSILWHFQNNPSFGYPDLSLVSGVVVVIKSRTSILLQDAYGVNDLKRKVIYLY